MIIIKGGPMSDNSCHYFSVGKMYNKNSQCDLRVSFVGIYHNVAV